MAASVGSIIVWDWLYRWHTLEVGDDPKSDLAARIDAAVERASCGAVVSRLKEEADKAYVTANKRFLVCGQDGFTIQLQERADALAHVLDYFQTKSPDVTPGPSVLQQMRDRGWGPSRSELPQRSTITPRTEALSCCKCGGADIYTRYRAKGCMLDEDYAFTGTAGTELLRRYCRSCGYRWSDPVEHPKRDQGD